MEFIHVTRANLQATIAHLNTHPTLVFDTETTGLHAYHDSKMFSLAVSDGEKCYYFNFKDYKDLSDDLLLHPLELRELMEYEKHWIAHNAKFDLHFCAKAGIKPIGPIIDTEVLARLFENTHLKYSLEECAKRWLSVEKDDRVKTWLEENDAFDMRYDVNRRAQKHYYYDLVPFELISEYAMKDVEVTWALYKFLSSKEMPACLETEVKLTSALFEMENRGVLVDVAFCQNAFEHHSKEVEALELKFKAEFEQDFTDSAKFLGPFFNALGYTLPKTKKENDQLSDDVLNSFGDCPLASLVLSHRDNKKRATTYFANYLNLVGPTDHVIHPNFRQSGTKTGRMSCNAPNLQNVPTDDDGPFPIRRAFIPRDGYFFVSIDYAQMEFRLMLEYANETDLIEKLKAGHDPHDATAELTGLNRKAAKTLNFGLLYGMGVAKLAQAIGVTDDKAKSFKYRYFGALPRVKQFIRNTADTQSSRGYVVAWSGRKFLLETYTDPITQRSFDFSYKAANSIIQGGCADICKRAMVEIRDFLRDKQTKQILQVHDEILFEVPQNEAGIVRTLKEIMERAYQAKNMPMACSVSYSFKNFHDMKEIEGEVTEASFET